VPAQKAEKRPPVSNLPAELSNDADIVGRISDALGGPHGGDAPWVIPTACDALGDRRGGDALNDPHGGDAPYKSHGRCTGDPHGR
jgi:hypothetical protein